MKDGVLCRDTEDPLRFFLIAEWSDIEEHAKIRKILANEIKPDFIKYIEGGKFIPKYVEIVSSDSGRNPAEGAPSDVICHVSSTRSSGPRPRSV